jgi:hypothetical protein
LKNALKVLLAPVAQPLLSKIHRYKDAYKGQSCYLIGGGVSIKWFDFGAFSNKISMPCQFIPFHNDFHKLRVEHLLLPEPYFFYPFADGGVHGRFWRNTMHSPYRKVITENSDKNFILNLSNYPVIRSPNITFLFQDFYDDRLPANFITRRINAFHGSLRTSISLAIYMGFDHVYLVGYDYTHVPSRNLHWFEKGQGVFVPHENYNKDYFEIAKEFIDITTITLDGTSDFINAVTYKEHTGRDPEYRENTELIDEQRLKVLATWPGYSIY